MNAWNLLAAFIIGAAVDQIACRAALRRYLRDNPRPNREDGP